MSVANILDGNGKVQRQYAPTFVEDKIKAIEEFIHVVLEAVELDGYTYTGAFQNVALIAPPTQPTTTEPVTTITQNSAVATPAKPPVITEDPVSENPQNVA